MKTSMTLCFTLLLAACGSESQEPSDTDPARAGAATVDNRDVFVGTWRPVSSTTSGTCGSAAPESHIRSASLVWRKGAADQLIASDASGFCPVTARATSATATAVSGQGCVASDGAYGFYSITRTGYTFTVKPLSNTAEENLTANIEYSEGGTVLAACAYVGQATYQRVGADITTVN